MKLCALFLLVAAVSTGADQLPADWQIPLYGGEIQKQFPKHPGRRVMRALDLDCRPTTYGITQIGIETTECYGKCPVYTFIVNSDGTFHYHGDKYTKRRGDWHGTVAPGRLDAILLYLSEMGYFELADVYTNHLSDGPGTFSMVKTRRGKKVIYDYDDSGPGKLRALESLIDDLQTGAKWKRGRAD